MKDGRFPWQRRKGQEEELRRWDGWRRPHRQTPAFLHLLMKQGGTRRPGGLQQHQEGQRRTGPPSCGAVGGARQRQRRDWLVSPPHGRERMSTSAVSYGSARTRQVETYLTCLSPRRPDHPLGSRTGSLVWRRVATEQQQQAAPALDL